MNGKTIPPTSKHQGKYQILASIPSAEDRLYYFLLGHLPGESKKQNMEGQIVRQWDFIKRGAKNPVKEYEQTVSETSEAMSQAFLRWDWKFFENISKEMRLIKTNRPWQPDLRLLAYLKADKKGSINLTELARGFTVGKSGSDFDAHYKFFKRLHRALRRRRGSESE